VLHELTSGEARLLCVLFPHLAGLDLRRVEDLGDHGVLITAGTSAVSAACRGCGAASGRVHDRYRRRLRDLACGGRPAQVVLEARRFRCGNAECPVATFAEQVPGLTARADPPPALHSFANGLERDLGAVLNGLTLPWSSGAVEGTNCKIKHIKRIMYGRANFDLLRKMAMLN